MASETISLSYSSSTKSQQSVRILVVDDDPICLSVVAATLKKFKFEVVTAKHPNDALCALRIKNGTLNLVVTDVHMPDMNGFELQQTITQEFNLPVVLMSADKGLDNSGVSSFFISKPVRPDDVRNLWQFATNSIEEENVNGSKKSTVSETDVDYNEKSSSPMSKGHKKELKRKGSINDHESNSEDQKGETKKAKVVWTNALHNRFLEAIRTIGLERSVPKKILEFMNVPGLTRENVASHLQKYRIFLRRVSEASYNMQYSHQGIKGGLTGSRLTPSFFTAPATSSSFSKFQYEKLPGQHNFPASFDASNSNINLLTQSRFLFKPNDRNNDQTTEFRTTSLFQMHPASLSSSLLGVTPITNHHQNQLHQMNGLDYNYKITSIQSLAESGSGCRGYENTLYGGNNDFVNTAGAVADDMSLPNDDFSDLDRLLSQYLGNTTWPSSTAASDMVNDNLIQPDVNENLLLPSNYTPVLVAPEIEEQNQQRPGFNPIYELPPFDYIVSNQQPSLVQDTDVQEQVNIQSQGGGGVGSVASSTLYGDTSSWDNLVSTLDQAAFGQQQQQQQGQDIFGASSTQFINNTNTLPSDPVFESYDNDEFLESLLASVPFDEQP